MPEHFYQVFFADAEAGDEFYRKVIEVEVESNADQADTFRLKLGLSLQDAGQWSEVDSDELALFTKVRVEAGFCRRPHDIHSLVDVRDMSRRE